MRIDVLNTMVVVVLHYLYSVKKKKYWQKLPYFGLTGATNFLPFNPSNPPKC